MSEELIPTAEEESIIRALRRLGKRWPKTLRLYTNSEGTLYLFRTDEDGHCHYLPDVLNPETDNGEIDARYLLETFSIPTDGGCQCICH